MWKKNITHIGEFILVGFRASPWLQVLLFFLFLITYLFVLLENLVIILTVWVSASLHKPMYYFLGTMSFLETWYISVTVPKMLAGFLLCPNTISFLGCMTQLYFFLSLPVLNVCCWLPWPMTAMWLYVGLFDIHS